MISSNLTYYVETYFPQDTSGAINLFLSTYYKLKATFCIKVLKEAWFSTSIAIKKDSNNNYQGYFLPLFHYYKELDKVSC